MEQERIGSWMQTFTGRKFFPLDPRIEDIDIRDIAHSLSLTCRYGGHVTEFYSVAEHCVLMSHAVRPENAFWALMHDSAEAYVGDMVRPLKQDMPQYKSAENTILALIALGVGLDLSSHGIPAEVHEADNRILLTEKNELMPNAPEPWFQEGRYEPLPVTLQCWSPGHAERKFMQRFVELVG